MTNAQGQRINGMGGLAQTAGAATQAAMAPAYYMQPSGDKCIVSNYDELKEAVRTLMVVLWDRPIRSIDWGGGPTAARPGRRALIAASRD